MPNQDKPLKHLAALSGIGIQMGVIIYVFVRLGQWLDVSINTSKKIFVAIGALIGVAAGLYVALRQLKKSQNK
ncbi:AtpZ/AtpI family protein [Flavobacteriaceae bacterium]|nr:AtpZ/AtpI family protein [Flavobacteriaceae bacterium]MDA9846654.1 AtpZ/AtpI family protein [Flavobacteriaceae bacterium]MDC3300828.1 AtpZ/AtpI family protein [Flavobacteriaceae bacterium]